MEFDGRTIILRRRNYSPLSQKLYGLPDRRMSFPDGRSSYSSFRGDCMEYLGFMNGKEAIRLAKEVSGLTESQIAAGLGVSVSVVKRYLKDDPPALRRIGEYDTP